MRRHMLWHLIWIQTVFKGLHNSVPALKELFIPTKQTHIGSWQAKCMEDQLEKLFVHRCMTAVYFQTDNMKHERQLTFLYNLAADYVGLIPLCQYLRQTPGLCTLFEVNVL